MVNNPQISSDYGRIRQIVRQMGRREVAGLTVLPSQLAEIARLKASIAEQQLAGASS